MAIPQEEYINITSGVVKDAVSNRELIGRVLVSDEITPLYALEFTSLASVGSYYGLDSHQYKFAEKYFNFISKDIKKPKKLSFCKYVKPGGQDIKTVAFSKLGWKPETSTTQAGSGIMLTITVDGQYIEIVYPQEDLNTLEELASHITSGINEIGLEGGVTITVSYIKDPSRFIFEFSDSSNHNISFSGAYASKLGLDTNIYVEGLSAPSTWSEMMDMIDDSNNNFGTFCLLTSDLITDDIVDISTWNNGKNVKYMYVQTVKSGNAETVFEALKDIGGTWLQLTNVTYGISYDAFAPMAIGATFNYNKVNTNAFFDFYPVPGMEIAVDNVDDFNKYTGYRTNFNGVTQQAGREIAFLQPGYLTGAISDAGVYYNEMWLKDDIWTKLMALFLAVKKIPANEVGKMQCKNTIMTTIEQAKVNGSILVGKTLTNAQKAQIQEYTADDNAVNKIQDDGFYLILDVERTTFADTNKQDVEKYIITYSLLYAKGDGIRKVEGTNILY